MLHRIKEGIKNAPLARKFLMLLLPGISLFAIFILVGFLLIIQSSNHMLYQTSGLFFKRYFPRSAYCTGNGKFHFRGHDCANCPF